MEGHSARLPSRNEVHRGSHFSRCQVPPILGRFCGFWGVLLQDCAQHVKMFSTYCTVVWSAWVGVVKGPAGHAAFLGRPQSSSCLIIDGTDGEPEA